MRFAKTFAAAAMITCLTVTAAFAAVDASASSTLTQQQQTETVKKDNNKFDKKGFKSKKGQHDPIKALQSKKDKIQMQLKEGKITQEKADEITAKIELRIKEVQEFNNLTLQQKKDKLISDFKASIDKRVEDGKLTQDKGKELIEKFTEKLNQWDGNGYPKFGKRGFGGKCDLKNK